MPFKERSFPPGWRPLDDIEHWPFETEDGLRIACEELGIRVDDDEGFSMDGVGCLNSLMEHYGLPNRDAGSCAVHDMQDEKVYNEFLSEAEKSRYNLVRAGRYPKRRDRDHDPLNLTTIFHLKHRQAKQENLVRVGPKGCNCLCKYFSVCLSISLPHYLPR